MKLGLGRRGLSFGGSGGPPKPVTDFFNGFELSVSTYTGGPTVVSDNTGALVTSPADVLPIEGMRLSGSTWLPTTSLGAPIHPSTPLRTRKGTVSVYGEDFRGPLIEPARTNLLTYSGQFDTGAWVKASGVTVDNLGDGVFRVNFAADGVGIFQANRVTYTNGSIISRAVWFKSEVSSGAVITSDPGANGGGAISHNVTTEWTRFFATVTKTGAGSDGGLWIRKAAGGLSSVLVKFAQVELASFSTSYIPTAATTVTRPAANLTRPTAGTALAALNNWGIRLRFRPTAAGQTAVLWGSYTDANNSTRIDLAASTLTYTKRLSGSNHVAQASLTHAAATLYDVIIYQHSVSGMGIAFRSWNGSAWSAWSAWATLTDANGIANAAIASTCQLGALNNASHVSANMPFCHVFALNPALAAQTEIADLLAKGRI